MRIVAPVLAAHYLAAFTALGMPLFMPRVLQGLAPGAPDWLSGVLYVLPTVCTALTAGAWGRLADKHGRKLSLLRAQLGLAVGFLLAGVAPSLPWFVLALIIQGSCGGSLAAANAYLSTQAHGASLSRALDWTQFSARLAIVTAPVVLGLATARGQAQALYGYLALLPLLALLLTCALPTDRVEATTAPRAEAHHPGGPSTPPDMGALLGVQFLFYFGMVVTFPYFIPYSEHLGVIGDSRAGLLYSLPHLIYLLALPWLRSVGSEPWARLCTGLGLFCGACVAQALITRAPWLWPARVLFGLGMLLAFSGINRALSRHAERRAGRLFGRFDACGKWAGATGGVIAGVTTHRYGPAAPFAAAALSSAFALAVAFVVFHPRTTRQAHVAATDP